MLNYDEEIHRLASEGDISCTLFSAVINNDILKILHLLEHSPKLNMIDYNGQTIFHRSIINKNEFVLQHLLSILPENEKSNLILNRKDYKNFTIFDYAILQCNLKIIKILLKRNCSFHPNIKFYIHRQLYSNKNGNSNDLKFNPVPYPRAMTATSRNTSRRITNFQPSAKYQWKSRLARHHQTDDTFRSLDFSIQKNISIDNVRTKPSIERDDDYDNDRVVEEKYDKFKKDFLDRKKHSLVDNNYQFSYEYYEMMEKHLSPFTKYHSQHRNLGRIYKEPVSFRFHTRLHLPTKLTISTTHHDFTSTFIPSPKEFTLVFLYKLIPNLCKREDLKEILLPYLPPDEVVETPIIYQTKKKSVRKKSSKKKKKK
ncbi:hypothetical protein SNEBB_005702 [Seison nebaliae]|nr:hypothetical protein SNEBB_005702 [Seison nebaliae]